MLATAAIVDPATGQETLQSWQLAAPRARHTATVLADGRVLVFGGMTTGQSLSQTAELVVAETGSSDSFAAPAPLVRADHTATLLTDGTVLVAGGLSATADLADTGVWNPTAESFQAWNVPPAQRRRQHGAILDGAGAVVVTGGVDVNEQALASAQHLLPDSPRIVDPFQPVVPSATTLTGSVPADGVTNVATGTVIALRFALPIQMTSANSATVGLSSSRGTVLVRAAAAEGGRLVFVTPVGALDPGTTYEVSAAGLLDLAGATVPPRTISFTTSGPAPTTAPDDDDAAAAATSPWKRLPMLDAGAGVTAIAGQVLKLNGQPLRGVKLAIEGESETFTDASGRFLLTALSEGHHELVIDGQSANTAGATYGRFEVGVEAHAGRTSALGYTVWMPKLDTAHAVHVASPTTAETVITTPKLPGLELRLPAGTVITDEDGNTVTQVSITPIPIDRPPFPLPHVIVPIYFTVQPGGAYLNTPAGTIARLVYPNRFRQPVGSTFEFWNYDAEERGWYVYGNGSVVAPGRQIHPGAGVGIYEFSGAMVGDREFGPPNGPPAPAGANGGGGATGPQPRHPDGSDGEPVDLSTGLFVLNEMDVMIPDVTPIEFARTYRPDDRTSRPFGIGATIRMSYCLLATRSLTRLWIWCFLPADACTFHGSRLARAS